MKFKPYNLCFELLTPWQQEDLSLDQCCTVYEVGLYKAFSSSRSHDESATAYTWSDISISMLGTRTRDEGASDEVLTMSVSWLGGAF